MHVKPSLQKGFPVYISTRLITIKILPGKPRVRSKMIESLGRLDDLKKIYDDPVAHFKAVCEQRTLEKKKTGAFLWQLTWMP